jgi:DHA3 family macrolide efflux protein-like MFS transporter
MIGRAIGETFQMPALGASIPMIVPEEHLVRANGLFQMLQSGIRVVAPPAGAFLMEALPMQGVLSMDIITAIIAVACLLPLVIPRPERTTLTEKANHLDDMKQGFQYVGTRRGLVILIGMIALLFFFVAPAASLIPVLVNTHLEGDVLKLGWLTSASGIGGVAGGLLLGAWGGLSRRIHTVILGLMIMIPCSVGLGLTSPSIYYATTIPSMFFMGVGISFFSAPSNAIMQTVVTKDMQGRVFALYGSLVAAAFPLGLIIGGPVADAFGIRSLYFIASGAWLIILSLALLSKSLMNLEYQKAEDNYMVESGVKND